HTRFSRDWSSDVCSSDLILLPLIAQRVVARSYYAKGGCLAKRRCLINRLSNNRRRPIRRRSGCWHWCWSGLCSLRSIEHEIEGRSEERRVGKEGRGGGVG